MSINADDLVKQTQLKLEKTEQRIKKLQREALRLGQLEAMTISQMFLDNDLNFPEQVISLSSSGALKSLVVLFQKRLLKEDELTPVLLRFLAREDVSKDKVIQTRIEESFDAWSDAVKVKFAFACPHAQLHYRYQFINEFLRQYSVGQDNIAWQQKLPLQLQRFNPETLTSLMSIHLGFVDSPEKVKAVAAQIRKLMQLGYNEKRIYFSDIEFVIEIEDGAAKLVEDCRLYPDTYDFSGSFEEQLEKAILKAAQIKSSSERSHED